MIVSTTKTQNMLEAVNEDLFLRHFPTAKVLFQNKGSDSPNSMMNRLLADIDVHSGKKVCFPNAVLDYIDRQWLILLEIVKYNGVIGSIRRQELLTLFSPITERRIVMITAFEDMDEFSQYHAEIAWNTSAWIAEAPEHFIIFNGQNLMAPLNLRVT